MVLIFVRARKDRKAISHVIEKIYKDVAVYSFGGVRGDALIEAIEEIIKNPTDYTLILLGKEDKKYFDKELSTPLVKIHFFWKNKIRNGRFLELLKLIERGKARFLLDIKWKDSCYSLGIPSDFIELLYGTDIFLADEKYKHLIQEYVGQDTKGSILIHYKRNICTVYVGAKRILDIDMYLTRREGSKHRDIIGMDIDVKDVLRKNRKYIREKEKFAVEKIKSIAARFDNIIVPLSGGKDSAAVLVLTKLAVKDPIAIYVDTGFEFEESREYVEMLCKKLKVELHTVHADISDIASQPALLRARQCTKRKVSSLYSYIQKNFDNPIILSGDRVAESIRRSVRPELRKDIFWIYSPIRYWSYLDIQLLLEKYGLELNPLYYLGLYRTGCWICPFMTPLEKRIVEKIKPSSLSL